MTVKEAVGVLKHAKAIALGWDGCTIRFYPDNVLMMEAYGNFVVDDIRFIGTNEEECYEIDVAMQPVRAGA